MISQATYFSFDSYNIGEDRRTLSFLYSVGFNTGIVSRFVDKIILPEAIPQTVPPRLLEAILQPLHLILGVSYWKLYCPKEMKVNSCKLNAEQAAFWNTVYTRGLGEFFYRNELDFRGLISFPVSQKVDPNPIHFSPQNRSLVGIAGGKDSLVTVELLKKSKKEITGLVIEANHEYPLVRELFPKMDIAGLFVRHEIDGKVKELNETGLVYNGHIPISAVYAFVGVLTAVVCDYSFFIVSNEKSANFGNAMYHGLEVNHQWSKSEEFEMFFRTYVNDFITPDVTYFSLLRPLTELKIVELFSKYHQYFPHFSSCNKNFTVFKKRSTGQWCGKCAKCAFMFLMLSTFLSKEEVTGIFGQNLFAEVALIPLYQQLLGIKDIKPFDCVGTFEEVAVAFYFVHEKGEFKDEPVVKMFERLVLPGMKDISKLKNHIFQVGDMHTIPEEFKTILNV
ncbi:hypothetical protein HZC27_06140 [Candidatus Roizmanbacteria bacterium]|nr:hypothetical protein [Candidatus Roizmanbacteria bacterium]